MNYLCVPLLVLMAIATGNLLVRSIQLKKARTAPPGGRIQI